MELFPAVGGSFAAPPFSLLEQSVVSVTKPICILLQWRMFMSVGGGCLELPRSLAQIIVCGTSNRVSIMLYLSLLELAVPVLVVKLKLSEHRGMYGLPPLRA